MCSFFSCFPCVFFVPRFRRSFFVFPVPSGGPVNLVPFPFSLSPWPKPGAYGLNLWRWPGSATPPPMVGRLCRCPAASGHAASPPSPGSVGPGAAPVAQGPPCPAPGGAHRLLPHPDRVPAPRPRRSAGPDPAVAAAYPGPPFLPAMAASNTLLGSFGGKGRAGLGWAGQHQRAPPPQALGLDQD